MSDAIVLQILALFLLLLVVGVSWWRWARPEWAGLDGQQRGMMILLLVTFAGGLLGSPFWWADYPASFSWDLPPLASRLLGAAALAFAVAGAVAFESDKRNVFRLYLIMLATYLVPLLVAAPVLHVDRFDWNAPITYGFFAIVGGMSAAALWHLLRGTELPNVPRPPDEKWSPPFTERAWLSFMAIVMGAWGLALFTLPDGPLPYVWLWPQDALTSRLIAVMLITLSIGAMLGARDITSAGMVLAMSAAYGAGGVAAGLWNATAGKPVPYAYVIAFGPLAVVSLGLLLARLASAPAPSVERPAA